MRKDQRTGDTIGTNLELPKDFSLKLARQILDLSERGVTVTKKDLLIKYAQIGFNEEIKKDSKNGTI